MGFLQTSDGESAYTISAEIDFAAILAMDPVTLALTINAIDSLFMVATGRSTPASVADDLLAHAQRWQAAQPAKALAGKFEQDAKTGDIGFTDGVTVTPITQGGKLLPAFVAASAQAAPAPTPDAPAPSVAPAPTPQ